MTGRPTRRARRPIEPRSWSRSALVVPAALAALLDSPRLEGAACAGQSPWWDSSIDGEEDGQRRRRIAASVALCRSCPVLADCEAMLDELPAGTEGVWAGRLLGREPNDDFQLDELVTTQKRRTP